MKRWMVLLLGAFLFVGISVAANKNHSSQAVISFTHSNPVSNQYYVEQKFNSSWKSVASGRRSPIVFIIKDIVPGTYTFRIRGQITTIQTTISQEFSYTVGSFFKQSTSPLK